MFSSENKDYSAIFLILFSWLSRNTREIVKDKLLIPGKKISKPKFLFIHLRSAFKVSLLISLTYYHVSSTFLILFTNEPFGSEENKQLLLSMDMKEGHRHPI